MDGSPPSIQLAQSIATRGDSFSQGNRPIQQSYNRNDANGRGNGFRGRGGRFGGRSRGKLVCQLCQKPGHSADRCWHRFEQSFMPQHNLNRQPQHQIPFQHQSFGNAHPSANLAQNRGVSTYAPSSEFSNDASSSISWYPDSGASHHVTQDLSNLNNAAEYHGGTALLLGDDFGLNIAHVGDSSVISPSQPHNSRSFLLSNLLHVPKISKNLLSVSNFAKDNHVFFEFHPHFCFVTDQVSKEVIIKGILEHGLYKFNLQKSSSTPAVSTIPKSPSANACSTLSASQSNASLLPRMLALLSSLLYFIRLVIGQIV